LDHTRANRIRTQFLPYALRACNPKLEKLVACRQSLAAASLEGAPWAWPIFANADHPKCLVRRLKPVVTSQRRPCSDLGHASLKEDKKLRNQSVFRPFCPLAPPVLRGHEFR